MSRFAFPYRIGPDGRTVGAEREVYVKGLIEQVLFTALGERVNRPDFGAGVREMLFNENAPELAAAVRHLVQGALQRWLGELIELRGVDTAAEGSKLTINVRYRALDEAQDRDLQIVREV